MKPARQARGAGEWRSLPAKARRRARDWVGGGGCRQVVWQVVGIRARRRLPVRRRGRFDCPLALRVGRWLRVCGWRSDRGKKAGVGGRRRRARGRVGRWKEVGGSKGARTGQRSRTRPQQPAAFAPAPAKPAPPQGYRRWPGYALRGAERSRKGGRDINKRRARAEGLTAGAYGARWTKRGADKYGRREEVRESPARRQARRVSRRNL